MRSPSAILGHVAPRLLQHAVNVMPADRKLWAIAMQRELADVEGEFAKLCWVWSCLYLSYLERFRSIRDLFRSSLANSMLKLGASILLITGLLCGGLFLWLDHRKYEVLSVPFPLLAGQHFHGQLQPTITGQYEITLNTVRSAVLKQQLCLLGVSLLNPPECDPDLSVVKMRWRIAQDKRLVAEGSSDNLNWGVWRRRMGAEGRMIGNANLDADNTYDLDVTSERDGAPLAKLDPTLQVRVSDLVSMGDGQIAQVVAIPALIAFLTGALVFLLGAFEWLNEKSYRAFGSER